MTGRRILRLTAPAQSPRSFGEEGIIWDGRDQDGDRLANGVYLYRLIARPADGGRERTWDGTIVVSR